jgi:hypothetical protein
MGADPARLSNWPVENSIQAAKPAYNAKRNVEAVGAVVGRLGR